MLIWMGKSVAESKAGRARACAYISKCEERTQKQLTLETYTFHEQSDSSSAQHNTHNINNTQNNHTNSWTILIHLQWYTCQTCVTLNRLDGAKFAPNSMCLYCRICEIFFTRVCFVSVSIYFSLFSFWFYGTEKSDAEYSLPI